MIARNFIAVALLALLAAAPISFAKDKSVSAILLFEGPRGPAYLQLTDINLNGKLEVYVCAKDKTFDSSAYHHMSHISLESGLELQRDADGALALKTAAAATCIAPQNLKLVKGAQLSAKELADKAILQGIVVGRSANAAEVTAIPALTAGFKLYIAPANDTELAEYLRAKHWHTLELLRMYTMQYPQGSHIGEIRQDLAGSITSVGDEELKAYVASLEAKAPELDHLQKAKVDVDDALKVIPGFVHAQKLQADVQTQVQVIVEEGRAELKAFQGALADRTPGYSHLRNASMRVEAAQKVDATLETVQRLAADILAEEQRIDQAVGAAQQSISRKQVDQGYNAIVRYRAMAPELPKVNGVVDAAFNFRKAAGDQFVKNAQWDSAITEYRRALEYKEDTATSAALKDAEEKLQVERDKAAAGQAVESSKALADKKQYVEAYELLTALTPAQRKFVADALDDLAKPFLQDAVKRADLLTRLHLPIHGRADEDSIRQGYHLLSEASRLTEEDAVKVKLDLLSDRISDYYLTQARQMFDKPRGSGVGLGWKYLEQAQLYKPDLSAIKDEMTKHSPMYDMRSKLSLGIRFRDETSRRDGGGLADQLTDVVSANLETSGIAALKIVIMQSRPTALGDSSTGQEPNFQLQCDIRQHKTTKTFDVDHVQSHFRAGTREVRNPKWAEIKDQLDAAQESYNRVRDDIIASGKKPKPTSEIGRNLQQMKDKADELRKQLNLLPETKLESIIEPYNYTKRTIHITADVQFAFRLADADEPAAKETVVTLPISKSATVLENVKPEDTDGVVEEGSPIDEGDVLNQAESSAEAELIKQIKEKLQGLTVRILEDARRRVSANDLDGAAEKYILYLNSTPGRDSNERTEAVKFLEQQYNLSPAVTMQQ